MAGPHVRVSVRKSMNLVSMSAGDHHQPPNRLSRDIARASLENGNGILSDGDNNRRYCDEGYSRCPHYTEACNRVDRASLSLRA